MLAGRYDLDRQCWSIARSEAADGEIAEPPPRAGHTATALPRRVGGCSAGDTDIAVFGGYNKQGLLSLEAGALALASLSADGSRLRWRLVRSEASSTAAGLSTAIP